MKCYARWAQDTEGNTYRDQTILQYGDSWKILGNVILLNPGSAKPLDGEAKNSLLAEKFPCFHNAGDYLETSIDPLMRYMFGLFSEKYPNGGVIRLYNLFNLKETDSGVALDKFRQYSDETRMMTPLDEIDFCDSTVIIATGGNVHSDEKLEKRLSEYISAASKDKLYAIVKNGDIWDMHEVNTQY